MSIFGSAELRARIAATSKDEVVLEEMIRRGFWKSGEGAPSPPEALIKRQGEIRKELGDLAADAFAYSNSEQALKKIQIERMKAARERRKETKLKNAKVRHERAVAWHARQAKEITHLGDEVSAALHGKEANAQRLAAFKLPTIADAPALAAAMGIKLGELRFLAFDRKVATVDHYARFTIPKKTGGVREISAPMPRLKRAQYWILANILAKMPGHDASHGFRPKHSIVTNATPHAGKRVVVNIDLKDFFPSISYARVKGLFISLGYAEKVAAVLALICTDAERDKVQVDGKTWSVAREGRRLPQGAPTSPAIANIIANRLDKRMAGAARKLGFTYTRYADDMTFSGDAAPGTTLVNRMIWQARQIAEAEGFKFNDKKTRVMGRGTRQDVTGLVVNAKPAVSREERRRFRAWLHGAEKAAVTRSASPQWTNGKGVLSDALGFASYLAMVDKAQGPALVARTKAVMFGGRPPARKANIVKPTTPSKVDAFRAASAAGKAPTETWWTPQERAAPQFEAIEAPRPNVHSKTAGSSVPNVPREAPAVPPSSTWGNTGQRQTRAGTSGASPSPQPAQQQSGQGSGMSLLMSLGALAVAGIPVVGPLLAGVLLFLIWRRYMQGRK